jgi:hypothetical protein
LVFSIFLGPTLGKYLGAGRVGKDIVRFLWLGNLSELVFPVWFGGRGLVEELVDISLFSCSVLFSCLSFWLRCIMG